MNADDIIRLAEAAEAEACFSDGHGHEEEPVANGPLATISANNPGAFSHADFGDEMISRRMMRFIDGAPAIWDGAHYLVGREAIFSAMVEMERGIRSSQRNEVMSYLQLRAPRVPIADPRFIAFENGVLDLKTLDLLTCTPELAITNVIPHNWNPDAVCRALDAALDAWTCGHDDRRRFLEEVVGLCMYRGREFQMCPILLGEGSNGKSTFLNLLRYAIGESNVSALDIQAIGARFQSVALVGKLANIADDISSKFVDGNALSVLKKVISGDQIMGEYKGAETFDFRPYCTIVLSANQMPRMKDSNEGIMRRLAPILFEAKFSSSMGNLDINLPRVLEEEAAYERLLFLGVTALCEALKRGALTETLERSELVNEMRQDNSSVYQFACEVLGFGSEEARGIIGFSTSELFDDYCDFCNEANRPKVARNSFTSEMARIYGVGHARKWMPTSRGKRQMSCFVSKP